MLPDFPSIKEKFVSLYNKAIDNGINSDPITGRIIRIHIFEGNRIPSFPDGSERQFDEYSNEIPVDNQKIIEEGTYYFIKLIPNIIANSIKQKKMQLYRVIDETTSATGLKIALSKDNITSDSILNLLEKMDFSFNSAGRCNLQFNANPSDPFSKIIYDSFSNPEFKKKFEELINKKREQFYVRESNRKLVD